MRGGQLPSGLVGCLLFSIFCVCFFSSVFFVCSSPFFLGRVPLESQELCPFFGEVFPCKVKQPKKDATGRMLCRVAVRVFVSFFY